jgi:hypothetical protein
MLALAVGHDVEDHVVHVLGRQRRMIQLLDVAMDADTRGLAGGEVRVGRAALVRKSQQLGNVHIGPPDTAV